jgi:transaldolase
MVDPPNTTQAKDAARNSLVALAAEGQSIWLDHITRDLVRGGELRRLIAEEGLRGMTSNPTIFQQAIAAGDAYDDQIRKLVAQGKGAGEIFEALAVTDIRDACDLFRLLYDETGGGDGFVSIEVSPALAHDTEATLEEARRLWQAVDRPNVMVKVPGTDEGTPAVRRLLAEGVNVNVTLLFSLRNHERVMRAYIEALEERLNQGKPVNRLASVASYFVSRVDTHVDGLLEEKIEQARDESEREWLRNLLGKVAIANARLAYARFREVFGGEWFRRLEHQGARLQRPLWGSTSTKNPSYRDVLYVEELIGPDTVNTVPLETFKAFADHGRVYRTVDRDLGGARKVLAELEAAGISYDVVTQQLEDAGVEAFAKSYDKLIAGVERKRQDMQA